VSAGCSSPLTAAQLQLCEGTRRRRRNEPVERVERVERTQNPDQVGRGDGLARFDALYSGPRDTGPLAELTLGEVATEAEACETRTELPQDGFVA
jgi:hypothetical protein